MRAYITAAIIAFAFTSLSSTLAAQAPAATQGRGAPPAAPTNLQVLPKDIPRAELIATMRTFTAGLGVQCNYCHVQEGQGGRNDMAADEKVTKVTARAMMRMVTQANASIAAAVSSKPAASVVKVECATCHRGEAIPKNPPPPPPPAAPAAAAPRN